MGNGRLVPEREGNGCAAKKQNNPLGSGRSIYFCKNPAAARRVRLALAIAYPPVTIAPATGLHPKTKKRLVQSVKLAVCAGAILYLWDKVGLYDAARLADDPDRPVRLLDETGDQLRILRDGREESVPRSALAPDERLAPGRRPIERGLLTLARTADWSWGTWAILAFGPVTFLVAWRLQILLAAQEITVAYRESLLLNFAGNFFNFALPGTTGGDVYKAYHVARKTRKRAEGITIVLLDRAVGLVVFLFMAALVILLFWRTDMVGPFGEWVGVLTVAFCVGGALFFSRRLRRWIRYDALLTRLPFADLLKRIDETTFSLRFHRGMTALALTLTVVADLFIIICIYAAARSVGVHPAGDRTALDLFSACLLASVVGILLAAVPISFQGFGLMEAVFYKVLVEGQWATASQMLAITLGYRVIQIIWSLPGIAVPWLGFARPADADAVLPAKVSNPDYSCSPAASGRN